MPSGLELKPTRLMPLMERSECREVLLVECGAPAGEGHAQPAPEPPLQPPTCPPLTRPAVTWLRRPSHRPHTASPRTGPAPAPLPGAQHAHTCPPAPATGHPDTRTAPSTHCWAPGYARSPRHPDTHTGPSTAHAARDTHNPSTAPVGNRTQKQPPVPPSRTPGHAHNPQPRPGGHLDTCPAPNQAPRHTQPQHCSAGHPAPLPWQGTPSPPARPLHAGAPACERLQLGATCCGRRRGAGTAPGSNLPTGLHSGTEARGRGQALLFQHSARSVGTRAREVL